MCQRLQAASAGTAPGCKAADTTLFAVIMEAYLHGTSTRKGR
jgi:hypothetical protein